LVAALALTKTAVTFNPTVVVQAAAALVRPRLPCELQPVAWHHRGTVVATVLMRLMLRRRVVVAAVAPVLSVRLARR
jgi:hypothetical protein